MRCGSGSIRTACSRSGLTASDVTLALQGQNIQVASGVLNQPPVERQRAFQIAVQTLGRLADPEEFANIVVKQTPTAVVRLKDVARVELAAQDYSSNSYLDRDPAVALAVFQRPGSNALTTAQGMIRDDGRAVEAVPARHQVRHHLRSDPVHPGSRSTRSRRRSSRRSLLVVLVIVLFLQTWRAAIIPLVAIPVSLIGTFFLMATVRLHAQQPVAVRPGARDRHRGRRRHRRGRERRAQHRGGAEPARGRRSAAWTRSAPR